MSRLDILAFGAHPDDVEIGMGGTLAKYSEMGYKVGICDLTMAELSSNGSPELRQLEAAQASEFLGLTKRIQLALPDRGLSQISNEQLAEIVSVIRFYRPTFIFAPYKIDRHPDHGDCANVIKQAVFNAGIRRYICKDNLAAFKPNDLFYYFINGYERPDFVIDISSYVEQKESALLAYKSQFITTENSVQTPLTNNYVTVVKARDHLFGKETAVSYAEGFKTSKPLLVSDLFTGGERQE